MYIKGTGTFLRVALFGIWAGSWLGSCAPKGAPTSSDCATPLEQGTLPSEASALVFNPDPMTASGKTLLAPTSQDLDTLLESGSLERLTGQGILLGSNVDVRSGFCGGHFAFSGSNQFSYSRQQDEFSEVMSYFHGDRFLAEARAADPAVGDVVQIWAHCMRDDNAYFVRGVTSAGERVRLVCLGDSVGTPGASMAEDAYVVTHEVQHGITGEMYSPVIELNQFLEDEAGAINEGISDAMAQIHFALDVAAGLDPLIFARWALGEFRPGYDGVRGMHHCPKYDSDFPTCRNYALGAEGFSADHNTVSFSYPDGLGWRFTRGSETSSGTLHSIFQTFTSQEEIHVGGVVMAGALWDVFDRLRSLRGDSARVAIKRAVMEGLKHLPMPSVASVSPVTMPLFARSLVAAATDLGWSQRDLEETRAALRARGLLDAAQLGEHWGTANALTIVDDPRRLKDWASARGADPARIPQGILTGLNGRPDPGEVIALWFDIKNDSPLTAGGIELDVRSPNGVLDFLDTTFNPGFVSPSEAQIRYSKINGTAIVQALHSSNPNLNVAATNTYFGTNPAYTSRGFTAVFARVSPALHSGEWVDLVVRVRPSNGPELNLPFRFQVGV